MVKNNLRNVIVQGLGYVGSATLAAVSNAKNKYGKPLYNTIGLDLKTHEGIKRIKKINKGLFPFKSSDKNLVKQIKSAYIEKRISATYNTDCLKIADVVIVNLPLDIKLKKNKPYVNFVGFDKAILSIANNMSAKCLIIIETTVPPGTCENKVMPILFEGFKRRKMDKNKIKLAHSYERVMPGSKYLDSIINNWRVYSANNPTSSRMCKSFLESFINTSKFPLTKLSSMTSSETAKIIENSYRAVNIAFIEEWARFSEKVGINCFEIIEAIKKRPTHNNIRQPGLGVGGYCLTKDPYFASVSANQILDIKNLNFPFSEMGLAINKEMPKANINLLKSRIGSLNNKRVLVLGATYRSEVDDLRNSPSEALINKLKKDNAKVLIHDPYITKWKNYKVVLKLPDPKAFDILIIAVNHSFYKKLNFINWIKKRKKVIFDTSNILKEKSRLKLIENGCLIITTGRGD